MTPPPPTPSWPLPAYPTLPPTHMRMGGDHFRSDDDFVRGAFVDVQALESAAGLSPSSSILDWGCGAGRLAVGLKMRFGHVESYVGVDVQEKLIAWATEHLADSHTRFVLSRDRHDRYNPSGQPRQPLDLADDSFDIVYAYSVFSHLLESDTQTYLVELARLVRPQGRMLLTAFVEVGVGKTAENPPGYGPLSWSGRLHCVRYDLARFRDLFQAAGLRELAFSHGTETDGQSRFVLTTGA